MTSQLQKLLVGEPLEQRGYISQHALARRPEGLGEIVHDGFETRFAGAALDHFGGNRIGLEHALWRQQYPAALSLIMDEPYAARQARTGVRQDRWRRSGGTHVGVSF